jgi:DNA-binding MarR family transcriptional regulator
MLGEVWRRRRWPFCFEIKINDRHYHLDFKVNRTIMPRPSPSAAPSPATEADAVDAILAQWQRERPDLDTRPMGLIGRIKRCELLLQRGLEPVFSAHGLGRWEFDVLATLRRSGAPHALTPTALFSSMMVSSGTMTHRLQCLEAAGWVHRQDNPADARSQLVVLSPEGLALIDRVVTEHVANEHRLLAALSPAEQHALNQGLTRLLAVLQADDHASRTHPSPLSRKAAGRRGR